MRNIIIPTLAFGLATTAALAQEPTGKTWNDATCAVSLSSTPDGTFTIATADGAYRAQCRIADWPISSPTAAMACQDGSEARMTLSDDGVVEWAGSPLRITGHYKARAGEALTLIPRGDSRDRCE